MNNISITENGAIGFKTTGSKLVDLNFSATSYRNNPSEAVRHFEEAYAENPVLAMRWLFYCRDVRGGMGERAIPRAIYKWLQWKKPDVLKKVLDLLPEFGRWDDVVYLMEFSGVRDEAYNLVIKQLNSDMDNLRDGKSVSLLGKWLPSLGASNKQVKMRANYLAKRMNLSYAEYSRMCSALRRQIGIVERQMVNNDWRDITYENLPSKANLKYRKAFLRHDPERYTEYIQKVNSGEAKMNASVLMPYEIVHKYTRGHHNVYGGVQDELEAMWKNLPQIECNGLVMLDGSGSMSSPISGNYTAHDVADSLAIYFSEQTKGPMHGLFMTFGAKPRFVDISGCKNLYESLEIVSEHTDCSNTDIFAAYKMLADLAVSQGLKQEDLPERIVIVSDMEFDYGCCGVYNDVEDGTPWWRMDTRYKQADKALFDEIRAYWEDRGYKMPKLVFWNVNSRSKTVPLTENEMGVVLMSGFSAQTVKMALTGQDDPFLALYETLMDPRYDVVQERLMNKV